jgi:two-component system KDP operon response regulator KdpE
MTSVLIVDDEARFLRTLQINLQARGYEVTTAHNGATALELAAAVPVDAIILDLGLPDLDGIEIITRIRAYARTPIIVLSARHTSDAKIGALDAGADDYITKPFGLDELLARLRSALRRTGEPEERRIITTDAFNIDMARKQVTRDNAPLRLTPTEWEILALLVRNPGRLITQQQVLTEVWGPAYATETAYLRVYMTQLRRKLEPDPSTPRYLLTEPGMGYRFEP